MCFTPASVICSHLATERYRRLGPSLPSSQSPLSVTWVQSEMLSSLMDKQWEAKYLMPMSEIKVKKTVRMNHFNNNCGMLIENNRVEISRKRVIVVLHSNLPHYWDENCSSFWQRFINPSVEANVFSQLFWQLSRSSRLGREGGSPQKESNYFDLLVSVPSLLHHNDFYSSFQMNCNSITFHLEDFCLVLTSLLISSQLNFFPWKTWSYVLKLSFFNWIFSLVD